MSINKNIMILKYVINYSVLMKTLVRYIFKTRHIKNKKRISSIIQIHLKLSLYINFKNSNKNKKIYVNSSNLMPVIIIKICKNYIFSLFIELN